MIATYGIRDPDDGSEHVVGSGGVGKRVCFQRSVRLLEERADPLNLTGRPSNVVICKAAEQRQSQQSPHNAPQREREKETTYLI